VGGFLFGAGLLYGVLMFVPWVVVAAGPVIRIDPGGGALRGRPSRGLGADMAGR
jgi:hypothetical protein